MLLPLFLNPLLQLAEGIFFLSDGVSRGGAREGDALLVSLPGELDKALGHLTLSTSA